VVRGEIDLATQAEFRAVLSDLVVSGQVNLTIDLSGVEFIDSTGLRVLASQSTRFVKAGGSLVVRNPSPAVRRLLSLTFLDFLVGSGLAVEKRPELASLPLPG
jgi:anti-sigma B factor antagonist